MQSECDKIIRRLSNYNEYKELNEYKSKFVKQDNQLITGGKN